MRKLGNRMAMVPFAGYITVILNIGQLVNRRGYPVLESPGTIEVHHPWMCSILHIYKLYYSRVYIGLSGGILHACTCVGYRVMRYRLNCLGKLRLGNICYVQCTMYIIHCILYNVHC